MTWKQVQPKLLDGLKYERCRITIQTTTELVGGIPSNPQMIEAWIASQMKEVSAEERARIATATVAELPKLTEEAAEEKWNTFKVDEKGLYLEGRCIKAMLKENSNILKDILGKEEAKEKRAEDKKSKEAGAAPAKSKSRFTALKSKVAERVFVEETRVYLMRDNSHITKPDGRDEHPIHVMTPIGERTSIKRVDYVNPGVTLTFTVRWLKDGVMDVDLLGTIMAHAAMNGVGSDRSQGRGQFETLSFAIEESK